MSTDNDIKEMQSDIRAIRQQLEVLVCESRLKRMDTLSFLLELACKEVSVAPDAICKNANVENTSLTIQ